MLKIRNDDGAESQAIEASVASVTRPSARPGTTAFEPQYVDSEEGRAVIADIARYRQYKTRYFESLAPGQPFPEATKVAPSAQGGTEHEPAKNAACACAPTFDEGVGMAVALGEACAADCPEPPAPALRPSLHEELVQEWASRRSLREQLIDASAASPSPGSTNAAAQRSVRAAALRAAGSSNRPGGSATIADKRLAGRESDRQIGKARPMRFVDPGTSAYIETSPGPVVANGGLEQLGLCCPFCVTGDAVGGLAAVDTWMWNNVLSSPDGLHPAWQGRSVPNASIAIVSGDGRLVLARGYTNCDAFPNAYQRYFAQPTSRYRMMSVSKSITAAAILQLVEDGSLSLTDDVSTYVDAVTTYDGRTSSGILNGITIARLLTHTGGLSPNSSATSPRADFLNDPPGDDFNIATALGVSYPISMADIIQWVNAVGRNALGNTSLSYAYSNFGYALLTQVIEAVTASDYGSHVSDHLLSPVQAYYAWPGATERRFHGSDEVRYYNGTRASLASCYTARARTACNRDPYGQSVISGSPSRSSCVQVPYGGFNMDNFDGFGSWVSSPVELVRLYADLRAVSPTVLSAATAAQMMTAQVSTGGGNSYGYGLRTTGNGEWFHTGGNSGSRAGVYIFPINTATPTVRLDATGAVMVVAMNRKCDEVTGTGSWTTLLQSLGQMVGGIVNWGTSTDDLWSTYESEPPVW